MTKKERVEWRSKNIVSDNLYNTRESSNYYKKLEGLVPPKYTIISVELENPIVLLDQKKR